MSDLSINNDAWLSKLGSHLDTEGYGAATVSQHMGVARRFLADLDKHSVAITATRPKDIDRYLQQVPWTYPLRHEDLPDYRHWRSTPLNMLLRVVQGQCPPVVAAITPATELQQEISKAYSLWMSAFRGLARTTILCRRNQGCCFLVWLGDRATREELSRLTLHDVDAYMKHRAGSLRRISLKTVAGKMRSFLRWLHMSKRTTRDLSPTVIAPTIYAHEGIPCAIGAEDVKRVLAVTKDDQTAKGLRDYAILTLLSVR